MLLLLLFVGCEKEMENVRTKSFNFEATIEQLQSSDSTKVYFNNEQWIYWELGDQISIGSNMTTGSVTPAVGDLVNASPGTDFEDFNGVFIAALPENSKYFAGLHPKRDANRIIGSGEGTGESYTNFTMTLDLPAEQPRRGDEKEDLTFAKQVFPMVAWYGGHWDGAAGSTPFNLRFRALGCIVRIHLFNDTTVSATINNIVFSSRTGSDCMQLSGAFSVRDYNTFYPYLEAKASPSEEEKKVTLSFGTGGLTFAPGDLKTFYLVLPATKASLAINYKLAMEVNATTAEGDVQFTKNFSVSSRRNGYTNMRAIGVNKWTPASPRTSVTLAGCGTEARPFKVYTAEDLVYLRNCYNSSERKINGQPITENTYISIMRNDIVLTSSNWNSSSITDFVGHLNYAARASSTPGITNNSDIPLFQNIQTNGYVTGLTVKSDATINASAESLSPFCNVNRGVMRNCILRNATPSGVVTATSADLGGVAAQNVDGGMLIGCGCMANMAVSSGHVVGGICVKNLSNGSNESVVKECYISSAITISADAVGGIVYDNKGTLLDSYFDAKISSSTAHWGGIAYSNSTVYGKVENSYYSSEAQITTSGTVGGIVHTVTGGTVRYNRLIGYMSGAQLGGIVHTLSGGTVVDCYVNNINAQIIVANLAGTRIGGGIAAIVDGGTIHNSFMWVGNIVDNSTGATLGAVVGKLTGGTISNCYAYEDDTKNFYGATTLSGSDLNTALSTATDRCYLLGYSQTGITTYAADASGITTLLNNLNSHKGTATSWVVNDGNPPVLGTYTPAKKKRR